MVFTIARSYQTGLELVFLAGENTASLLDPAVTYSIPHIIVQKGADLVRGVVVSMFYARFLCKN